MFDKKQAAAFVEFVFSTLNSGYGENKLGCRNASKEEIVKKYFKKISKRIKRFAPDSQDIGLYDKIDIAVTKRSGMQSYLCASVCTFSLAALGGFGMVVNSCLTVTPGIRNGITIILGINCAINGMMSILGLGARHNKQREFKQSVIDIANIGLMEKGFELRDFDGYSAKLWQNLYYTAAGQERSVVGFIELR